MDWREEPIGRHHDRKGFDCGAAELNEYLARYARQNHESGGAKTFVAVSPAEPARVLGFYSISPGSIEFARVPADLTRTLGRYDVPVFRLGRLVVDRSMQGQSLGGDLVLAAGERTLAVAAEVGGVALAIDAKDQNAVGWYERFGAQQLLDDPLELILPLSVIADAIKGARRRRTWFSTAIPFRGLQVEHCGSFAGMSRARSCIVVQGVQRTLRQVVEKQGRGCSIIVLVIRCL